MDLPGADLPVPDGVKIAGDVSPADLVYVVWSGLVAAAWSAYSTQQLVASLFQGKPVGHDQERLRVAFHLVANSLPRSHPFRAALLDYLEKQIIPALQPAKALGLRAV